MRNIKFRALDANTKKWVTSDTYMTVNDGWTWHKEIDDHNPAVVLMQYTGLKDSKGNEIYEGDIVINSYLNQRNICSIKYLEGAFMVQWKNKYDPICEHYCNTNDFCSWLEVIGNVYENPELLTPPKE